MFPWLGTSRPQTERRCSRGCVQHQLRHQEKIFFPSFCPFGISKSESLVRGSGWARAGAGDSVGWQRRPWHWAPGTTVASNSPGISHANSASKTHAQLAGQSAYAVTKIAYVNGATVWESFPCGSEEHVLLAIAPHFSSQLPGSQNA